MPTKKQLSQLMESQFEFPATRREDDPMYKSPHSNNAVLCGPKAEPLPPCSHRPQYDEEVEGAIYCKICCKWIGGNGA